MKKYLIISAIILCISATYAQVGINADNSAPHSSAQLDVKSTTKAFYPPRMTTIEKEAIVGKQAGAVVFDNTLNQLSFYNGSTWVAAAGANLALPYNQSMSSEGTLFSITNTIQPDNSYYAEAFSAKITGNAGTAIHAEATKYNPTYHTTVIEGYNKSTNGYGFGIDGRHDGSGTGVFGYAETGYGIRANAGTGIGGHFNSNNGYALTTGKGNVGIGTSTPAARMDIKGTDYLSHFYFGANEDTYIRGGKAGSNVLINDIAGQGNVGIGNTNPGYLLDVNRRIRIRHTVDGTPDDNTAGIWYNNSANVEGAFSGMKADTEVGLFLGGNWRFWVNSGGQGYLNGALIQTSDKRLKKDFTHLNNSLSNIYKINGYHFRWIEEARNKDLQTGFIAQEVQKIFPELVQTDEKGFLSVNYIGLIPHLIEAVKDLKDENSSLKSENNSFKTNQNRLESRLDKLETLLNAFSKNTESN
ncbi:MAG: tail fiber domain-containing protein [Bacteroidota bacterium]